MLIEERHEYILHEVVLHNRILLTDISEKLNVSIDTVRRDVKFLDKQKKLMKVHGGAISLGYSNLGKKTEKEIYALEKKVIIANKAVKLLKDKSTILIHGGTTCIEFAKIIPDKTELTCFTFSLPVAMALTKKPHIRVVMLGGDLQKESLTVGGIKALNEIRQIKIDQCFMGTGYIDNNGLSEFDFDSVQIKTAIIASAKKPVIMTISEKLGSNQRFAVCPLQDIHTLITELSPVDTQLEAYSEIINRIY